MRCCGYWAALRQLLTTRRRSNTINCWAELTAALARIETKAKITTVDVSGSGTNQDAEKLLSRLEGTR